MDPKNAYLENQVNSATPIGLLILLHEGLINFAHKAMEAFIEANEESRIAGAEAVDRCIRIVTELNNSLKPDAAPQLCDRLTNLYAFFISELSAAMTLHDAKRVGNLIPLFEDLKDGWKQAEGIVSKSETIAVA